MSKPHPHPMPGDILVMVGTKKGTFLFWSDQRRQDWQRSQHHLGWMVHALSYDSRHGSIYAATNSAWFGAMVQRSDDCGRHWTHLNHGLDFAADEERRVREIWQVQPGHDERPDEVWAGSKEAGLFRSTDRGAKWEAVVGLNQHPTASTWMPGGGGLILHTIALDSSDANRLYACVSAGGAYRSDDGGTSWRPINQGVRADFMPDVYPETGQCVHKLVLHPQRPHVLYQQNHCGVYRSDDCGDSWVDISEGLPSRFGFPMAVHPHDPRTIYVVPLASDSERFVPEGRMAVWCSRDEGRSWEPLTQGLPDRAWLTILRESLAVDAGDPAGIYVGTTTGQVFYSRDAGERWQVLADYLPPVLSLSAATVVA